VGQDLRDSMKTLFPAKTESDVTAQHPMPIQQ